MSPQVSETFVYFIADDAGRVKIGFSGRPDKRLLSLQTGSSSKLRLLGALLGRRVDEQKWHKRFQSKRITNEWFQIDEELKAAISEACGETPLLVFRMPRKTAIKPSGKRHGDQEAGISARVQSFLKAKHPRRTALMVASDTGIKAATIAKLFERGSCLSTPSLIAMTITYGPEFLKTIYSGDLETPWVTKAYEDHLLGEATVRSRDAADWARLLTEVSSLKTTIESEASVGGFL